MKDSKDFTVSRILIPDVFCAVLVLGLSLTAGMTILVSDFFHKIAIYSGTSI